jgi:methylated-DNA-[protein]-cysteine S-methyltransferase
MNVRHATQETPVGPFTTIVDADGVVLASGWTADPETLRTLIHPTLRPVESAARTELGEITRAVAAYHGGDLTAVDAIPVAQRSGEFLEHAWRVLRMVPPGTTVTYRAFGELAGRPAATRAAASACARNAAALFVPCHRVIRTDGGMGGFRWGTDVKRWLIAHEE